MKSEKNIMNENDKRLWLKLYEVAKEIQKLEPWKYIWDNEYLLLKMPDSEDYIYCSVMGKAGEHKAISILTSDQMCKLVEAAENNYPYTSFLNYQECLMCNYVSRDSTLKENRDIIKEIGLKFRGEWISFENFEKGYEPSPLNIEQVKLMTEILKQFLEMFKLIVNDKVTIDFGKDQTLLRSFDKNTKQWNTMIVPLIVPVFKYSTLEIDDNFREEVKKFKRTDMEIEYEFLNYLPIRINNKKINNRYRYPRMQFMTERKSGMIVFSNLVNEEEYDSENDYILECVNIFVNFMMDVGIPKTVYVRDEESRSILSDVCKKAEINLVVSPRLKDIDKFYNLFIDGGI